MLLFAVFILASDDFIIVSDLNAIKYKSLNDVTSDHFYILYEGDKYFSSFSALAFDDVTQSVFFTEVNR